jgi:hypothetical protein
MRSDILRADGSQQALFDEPYSFGESHFYPKEYAIMTGDEVITSCTFNNDTDRGVPFGESSDDEMCYQFALAYPAHALGNGASSLLGQADSCW